MVLNSTALADKPFVLSQRYIAPSLGLINKSSLKLSCDHVRISRVVPVMADIPQPVKSSSDDALPTANRTIVLSECKTLAVPLAPLVDGPPPVPNVLLLIVPTVISSSSINIFFNKF